MHSLGKCCTLSPRSIVTPCLFPSPFPSADEESAAASDTEASISGSDDDDEQHSATGKGKYGKHKAGAHGAGGDKKRPPGRPPGMTNAAKKLKTGVGGDKGAGGKGTPVRPGSAGAAAAGAHKPGGRVTPAGAVAKPKATPQAPAKGAAGGKATHAGGAATLKPGEMLPPLLAPKQEPGRADAAAPFAVVGDDAAGNKFFCLVERLPRAATLQGYAVLRWLREGPDGVFRPTDSTWEERAGALIPVRTQTVGSGARGGFRLLTPRGTILETRLLD